MTLSRSAILGVSNLVNLRRKTNILILLNLIVSGSIELACDTLKSINSNGLSILKLVKDSNVSTLVLVLVGSNHSDVVSRVVADL